MNFFCLLVASMVLLAQGQNPVKVTTFYESLCPDSIRFFTRQLEPTYNDLSDIMTVELHAYGKASDVQRPSGEGYIFTCQHGQEECYGNKVLGCGQQYITDHETYLDFAFCVMAADNPPSSGEACAAEVGVTYDPIVQCANSTEGENFLHDVGVIQSQLDPELYYVPWIIINDVFTEENLDAAQDDLKSLVCSTYEGDLPSSCSA
ncbi:UNVERIFIED_CONTAM: hypothetical protein GTU68_005540 [Idotea baltica]|nr:hypothetical protein [Idotea baltica]